MIGSYYAGLSLSQLPSKVQIISKISSLRGFGMTVFYFMMGIYVHLDEAFFREGFICWSLLIASLNVLVAPIFLLPFAYIAGPNPKPQNPQTPHPISHTPNGKRQTAKARGQRGRGIGGERCARRG